MNYSKKFNFETKKITLNKCPEEFQTMSEFLFFFLFKFSLSIFCCWSFWWPLKKTEEETKKIKYDINNDNGGVDRAPNGELGFLWETSEDGRLWDTFGVLSGSLHN